MNRYSLALGLALACVTACASHKPARQYANVLNTVAQSYEKQVASKLAAEEESYHQLGMIYDQALQDNTYETLWLERSERSQKLADDILSAKAQRLPASQLLQSLRNYGDLDFQAIKQLLSAEQAAHLRMLAGLEDLQLELKSIHALSGALEDLGSPEKLSNRVKASIEYGKSVRTELDRLACADLRARLAELQAMQSGASAEASAQIAREISEIMDQLKSNHCD